MVFTKPDDWIESEYPCPSCKSPLFLKKDKGYLIWCARVMCRSIVCNEGGHGKNQEEAFAKLKMRAGIITKEPSV